MTNGNHLPVWPLLVALSLVSMARPTQACLICIAYPEKTVADHLIDATTVVLVREDPQNRFSYYPVEILKGTADGSAIDLFVDSVTRRLLAADEDRVVVLARESQTGAWRNLGIADEGFQAVVRRIVSHAPQWKSRDGKQRRLEFFAQLFGHENPVLFRLAYLEMARAPYPMIKRLSRSVSRDEINAMLNDRQYIEWRALALLMLAHVATDDDKNYLANSFESAAQFGLTRNLAALATAYIELNGDAAIELIQSEYFRDDKRTPKELVEVLKALSLHSTEGRTELRDRIVAAYEALLKVHPEMATHVSAARETRNPNMENRNRSE